MAILTVFNLPTMNAEKYDQIVRELEAAGHGMPKGRLYHVACRQDDGSFMVTDVWESAELLAAFGEALIPTLQKAGVTPVEPTVHTVHHVMKG
jgi:hypothetical protein